MKCVAVQEIAVTVQLDKQERHRALLAGIGKSNAILHMILDYFNDDRINWCYKDTASPMTFIFGHDVLKTLKITTPAEAEKAVKRAVDAAFAKMK